ncbi:MAG TPA: hypothetical protein VI299_08655 [Polyangiales bacterium]
MFVAPLALSGCIVDKPCDANEIDRSGRYGGCECAPGSVLNADKTECLPCGANEEVQQGACVCKTGFAKPSADAACVASQQGAACSGPSGCSGEFPYCAPGGYCTKSPCAGDNDCTVGGYACETSASPAYCSRPPTGQGKSCMTSADCAGTEATACLQGACLVAGCAKTTRCHGSWACCDYTSFGAADVCLPPSALSAGKCPGTMADPVTR